MWGGAVLPGATGGGGGIGSFPFSIEDVGEPSELWGWGGGRGVGGEAVVLVVLPSACSQEFGSSSRSSRQQALRDESLDLLHTIRQAHRPGTHSTGDHLCPVHGHRRYVRKSSGLCGWYGRE